MATTLRNSPEPSEAQKYAVRQFMSEALPWVLRVRRECNDDPLIIHKITTALFREIDRRAAAQKAAQRATRKSGV
jgi:hypothetical protein